MLSHSAEAVDVAGVAGGVPDDDGAPVQDSSTVLPNHTVAARSDGLAEQRRTFGRGPWPLPARESGIFAQIWGGWMRMVGWTTTSTDWASGSSSI